MVMLLTVAPVYLDGLYHLCNLHFCLSLDWLPIHACDLIACRQSPIQSGGGVVEDLQNSRGDNWKGTKVIVVLPKQGSSPFSRACAKKKTIHKTSLLAIKEQTLGWSLQTKLLYLDNVKTRAVLGPSANADSYEVVPIFL